MAILNITKLEQTKVPPLVNFKVSNSNINIDTLLLTVSEIKITEQKFLGNLN